MSAGSSTSSGERQVKLKCEFEKEDPAFLSDRIYMPTGFMELVNDFVYKVLLEQPPGGELSLAKFAKKYFAELLIVIGSNLADEEVASAESGSESNVEGSDTNVNFSPSGTARRTSAAAEEPLFTVDQVVIPEGLETLLDGLLDRALRKQPRETKYDLTEFVLNHFEKILSNYSDLDLTSEELENSNMNTNRENQLQTDDYTKRRCGISSENFDPDGSTKVTIIEKDAATTKRLKESAKEVMPLKHLDDKELATVIDVLTPLSVRAGATVIREGDDGDDFYIVDSGTFNIYKREQDNHKGQSLGRLISSLNGEGSFGELALMYNWPRQASVQAVTDGVLWVLNRTAFHIVSGNAAFRQRRDLQQIMGKVDILKQLNPEEIMNLCDAIIVRDFGDNAVIIRQNDEANSMFFLMEGEAIVSMTSSEGVSKEIQRLAPGSYFGEMALINMENRQATVTTVGNVRCGELNVDAFERLLGPCKEIMRRNQQAYRQQVAQVFNN